MQLIALVVAGYNDRELAKKLGVTEKTAKSCLARIFERVGAANRLELVLITLHRRLLDGAIVLHTSTSPC